MLGGDLRAGRLLGRNPVVGFEQFTDVSFGGLPRCLPRARAADEARERLDAGELTREEHDRLRDELAEQMPDAVRAQIPELVDEKPEASVPAQKTALVIEDDMTPTYTPSGLVPGLGS